MNDQDPRPGIRAVFMTGFVSANASALLYLAVRGVLLHALHQNPWAVLGGFLGIGLAGMMSAGICGLSVRLVLERTARRAWWPPISAAAASAALVGLLLVHWVYSLSMAH